MRRVLIVAAAMCVAATVAHGFAGVWTIGYWTVDQQDDPTDGSRRTIAGLHDGNATFALRCMNRRFDFAFSEPRPAGFVLGTTVPLTFHGDNYPPITIPAYADDDRMVEFPPTADLMREIMGSRTYALQYSIQGKVQITHIWQAGNIMSVLSQMQRDCPMRQS